MSELPQGWVQATLGGLGVWQGGGTPDKSNHAFWNAGTIPWVSPKDMKRFHISDAEDFITEAALAGSSASLIAKSSILIVTRSGILKHTLPVAINENEVAINQDLKALTLYPELDALFFAHQLRSLGPFVLKNCTKAGTTVDSVDFEKLKAVYASVPPLAEQKRIVTKLDALSAKSARARAELSRIETLVSRYKQAVLSKAFSGELTGEWRERTGVALTTEQIAEIHDAVDTALLSRKGARTRTHHVDLSIIADTPDTWAKGIVAVAAATLVGFAFKSEWFRDNGAKLLRGANIAPGALDWSDLKALDPSRAGEFGKYLVEAGDIVLAMDRPVISSGLKVARVTNEDQGCLLVQRVTRFRASEFADQSYLWLFLNSQTFLSHSLHRATGSDLPHISGDDISTCPIPLPSLEEQREIVRRIETAFAKIDRLAIEAKRALQLLGKLDEALLSMAFRGELVPQDEDDEPAEKLLERIRAERDAAPKARRRTRSASSRLDSKRRTTEMAKTRVDVEKDHLAQILRDNGGTNSPTDLWLQSGMDIDEFYKQLRAEIDSGHIREGSDKDQLVLIDAR